MTSDSIGMRKRGGCGLARPLQTPSIVRDALRSPGTPLDSATRAHFEPRFRHDFSSVRVHHNDRAAESASELSARAYTVGNHVVFGDGEYAPHSPRGQSLIAHELGHVMQRSTTPQRQPVEEPVAEPPLDESQMLIDAMPDLLLTDVKGPRRIGITVSDALIASIGWELVGPDGEVVAEIRTRKSDPDAKSRPYVLEPADLGDTGLFTLRCTGFDAKGASRARAVRSFNVLRSDLATGVHRQGLSGSLVFKKYDGFDAKDGGRPFVRVELAFLPSPSVDCDQVMFVQAVQLLNESGHRMHKEVNDDLPKRASETGWAIDKLEGARSPYYSVEPHPITGRLYVEKDLGKAGRGGPRPREASLLDEPNMSFSAVARFESCAMCRGGANNGQVYGCATWGFTVDAGKIKLMPRDLRDEPSKDFLGAAAGWNRWRADEKKKAADAASTGGAP